MAECRHVPLRFRWLVQDLLEFQEEVAVEAGLGAGVAGGAGLVDGEEDDDGPSPWLAPWTIRP